MADGTAPPAEGPPPKGPFGFVPRDDPWDWTYYVRPGKTPTDPEHELAEKIAGLSDRIERFRDSPGADDLREDLTRLFQATLDEGSAPAPRYLAMVDSHERRFMATIVTPRHRENLRWPVLVTVCVMLVILLGAQLPAATIQSVVQGWLGLSVDLSEMRPFAILVAGTLLGRLLYYATAWGEVVTDLDAYDLAQAQAGSPFLTLLFDLVVGVAACAVFVSGLVVITLAEGDGGAGAGFGTREIAQNGLVAFVVGILVGLAKTEFLARLRRTAASRVGETQ